MVCIVTVGFNYLITYKKLLNNTSFFSSGTINKRSLVRVKLL